MPYRAVTTCRHLAKVSDSCRTLQGGRARVIDHIKWHRSLLVCRLTGRVEVGIDGEGKGQEGGDSCGVV